jgi:hypothetical protein
MISLMTRLFAIPSRASESATAPAYSLAQAPAIAPDSYQSARPSSGAPGGTYIVRSGDSLTAIARRLGVPYVTLLAANPQLASGARRHVDGSRIFPGEVLALAAPTDTRLARLESIQRQQQAATELAAKKSALQSLISPYLTHDRDAIDGELARAGELLDGIPQNDPDHDALAAQFEVFSTGIAALRTANGELANRPLSVRAAKQAIQGLDAQSIALTTPDEKAGMIRNLVRHANASSAAQDQILQLLNAAVDKDELDAVVAALHAMTRKILFVNDSHFMDHALAYVLDDQHLQAFAAFATDSGNATLVAQANAERERRQAP